MSIGISYFLIMNSLNFHNKFKNKEKTNFSSMFPEITRRPDLALNLTEVIIRETAHV